MANSFNELFGLGSHSEDANLEGWWLCQDDAASTTVADQSSNGNDGTANVNTSTISTTGPNSWLAKGFDYTSDNINFGAISALNTASSLSLGGFFNPNLTTRGDMLGIWQGAGNRKILVTSGITSSKFSAYVDIGSFPHADQSGTYSTGTWYMVGGKHDGTDVLVNVDGTDATASASGSTSTSAIALVSGLSDGGLNVFSGKASGMFAFSRILTEAEFAQIANGPEPVNSVAPAVSGTETQGQTLSCTTGTWGLDTPLSSGSNGTITYAYQWTRSNDGTGTGEADISGATSSTYTLQAADVGKYIRCRVAASNDGGNDSGADTNSNFTGAIASSGSSVLPELYEQMPAQITPQPVVAVPY